MWDSDDSSGSGGGSSLFTWTESAGSAGESSFNTGATPKDNHGTSTWGDDHGFAAESRARQYQDAQEERSRKRELKRVNAWHFQIFGYENVNDELERRANEERLAKDRELRADQERDEREKERKKEEGSTNFLANKDKEEGDINRWPSNSSNFGTYNTMSSDINQPSSFSTSDDSAAISQFRPYNWTR